MTPGSTPSRLRILLTNHGLCHRGGTELYIRDVTSALLARGHFPMVYSPVLGTVAKEIEERGVPVVDSMSAISSEPDIIHGQHHLPAMAAMLQFPSTPATFACHGFLHWLEGPPRFPNIRKYIAVDEACQERLIAKNAISPDAVRLVLNFCDTSRFIKRKHPLPSWPRRALLISNYAPSSGPTDIVRNACTELGIELDVRGISSGRVLDHPEIHLQEYDLVFAKGRSAIEAVVVGAAVIPYHDVAFGPLVDTNNFEKLRRRNYGFSVMQYPLNQAGIVAEIRRYNPESTARVADAVQQSASLERATDELLQIYSTVIDTWNPAESFVRKQQVAVADYLSGIATEMLSVSRTQAELLERNSELFVATSQRDELAVNLSNLRTDLIEERERTARLQQDFAAARTTFEAQKICLHAEIASLQNEITVHRGEKAALQRTLMTIAASPTIRLRNLILRIPGLRAVARGARRFLKSVGTGAPAGDSRSEYDGRPKPSVQSW